MRIAFLGTPEFALPSLSMLIDRGDTLAVFTQPDRPIGRKAVLTPPPVKVLAEQHGIPVYQFEKIRSQEGLDALEAFAPDLMVTAAFGQLLSAKNLAIPKLGTINVHGSLLPKYRGASPIQTAILEGETVTGITTMMTDIGMDTGDILLKAETPIGENETYAELSERLSHLGAELLKETLHRLEGGTLKPIPQEDSQATKCKMLTKQDGILDFSQPMQTVHNRVRGLNPWPVASSSLDGQPLKIWETRLFDTAPSMQAECGTLTVYNRDLFVRCSDGWLKITSLQISGKKRMDASVFVRGTEVEGKRLGL